MLEFSFDNPDIPRFTKLLFHLYNDKETPFCEDFRRLSGDTGSFNHFVNVTTAIIHVMDYAEKHLNFSISNERKLYNIAAAFFHDLGKTKRNRRHAVIGACMLETADEKTKAAFDKFVPGEKLPYFAAIVNFHDVFGMVSCGEGSAVSIANAINRLRSVTGGVSAGNTVTGDSVSLNNAITDLWLLNIADIIVSYPNKFTLQAWAKTNPGELSETIEEFFDTFKGKKLVDDLKTAKEIAFEGLDAVKKAEEQAAERILCLTNEVFMKTALSDNKIFMDYTTDPARLNMIEAALKSEIGEDYKHAFGSFLQFDYSLGFFTEISKRILTSFGSITSTVDFNNILRIWYNVIAKIYAEAYRIKGDISWNIEFEEITDSITASDIDVLIGDDEKADRLRTNLLKKIFLYKS
jgi:hypothetical protein